MFKMTLKTNFHALLIVAIASFLILGYITILFIFRFEENQQLLLKANVIDISRSKMVTALSALLSKQENVLVAANSESLANISTKEVFQKEFIEGLKELTQVSKYYPDPAKELLFLQSAYKKFLVTDQQLFILKQSELKLQDQLKALSDKVNAEIDMMRTDADQINGILTLQSKKNQRDIQNYLQGQTKSKNSFGSDFLKQEVNKLLTNPLIDIQLVSQQLNTNLAVLAALMRQITNETNSDNLLNLKLNKFSQLNELISHEIEQLKDQTQKTPELSKTMDDISTSFKNVIYQIINSPSSIYELRKELSTKENLLQEEIQENQKNMIDTINEFNRLATITENLRNNLIATAKQLAFKNRLVVYYVILFFIIFMAVIGYSLLYILSKSLNSLTKAMKKITQEEGGLEYRLEKGLYNDLNQVVEAFNAMTKDLHFTHEHLHDLVASRTRDLEKKNKDLVIALDSLRKTQEQLIITEKMASLGNLVAGIAHEINTPLGAINASTSNMHASLEEAMQQLPILIKKFPTEKIDQFNALVKRSLRSQNVILTSAEERQYKYALEEHLEKSGISLASKIADTLVDMGIYINVDEFIPLFQDQNNLAILHLAYNFSSLNKNAATIAESVRRASKIIFALRNYAHYEQTGTRSVEDIRNGLETVLTLYYHQLKRDIHVIKNFKEVPAILCYPDELNQVWINLIHNAIYAMHNKGTITIDLYQEDNNLIVKVTDTGSGIPDEVKDRLFEPFFSTKPRGEGSGLGLSIVKNIIGKHGGQIAFESRPGKTTFTVSLPIDQQENASLDQRKEHD